MKLSILKKLIKAVIRESMGDGKVCPQCDGSGEGRYEGSKCNYCHGSGEAGYKPKLTKYTDPDYDWDGEREERKLGLDEAEGSEDKITPKEKKVMSQALGKMGLDGNKRFESVTQGLQTVTKVLDAMGFVLDMVTGDMILGPKGQRMLTFRRANDEGADPFTEKSQIKNSRITFVWENLSGDDFNPRYEILAYPS